MSYLMKLAAVGFAVVWAIVAWLGAADRSGWTALTTDQAESVRGGCCFEEDDPNNCYYPQLEDRECPLQADEQGNCPDDGWYEDEDEIARVKIVLPPEGMDDAVFGDELTCYRKYECDRHEFTPTNIVCLQGEFIDASPGIYPEYPVGYECEPPS